MVLAERAGFGQQEVLFVCVWGFVGLWVSWIGLMLYFAVLCLVGVWLGAYSLSEAGVINGVVGVVSGSFGWLFSVSLGRQRLGGVKVLRRLHLPRVSIGFGVLGALVGLSVGSMFAVPLMASDVDIRFGEAYGTDWGIGFPRLPCPI